MKTKFTISVFLLVCSFGLLQAQGWYVYDGTEIPDDVAGWSNSSNNPGANFVEQVVDDPVYPNKWLEYIQPDYFRADGVTAGARKYYRLDYTDRNPAITLVARIKGMAIDSLVNELAMYIELSEASATYDVREALKIVADDSTITLDRGGASIKVNANLNEWHTYRIAFSAADSISNVYFDEDVTPILTGKTTSSSSGNNYLRMGDGGSPRVAGYVDYVAIDTTGAYAPDGGVALPDDLLLLTPPYMISKWSFEETGAMVLDSGLLSLDGVLKDSSGVTRINCGVGQAINFATGLESSVKVIVPDNDAIAFDSTDSYSVSVLVKANPMANTSDQYIVQKGVIPNGEGNAGKWYGLSTKNAELRWSVDDQTTKSEVKLTGLDSTIFDPDIWHHVVGVRDRDEDSLKLYLDGVLVKSGLDNTNLSNNTAGRQLNIGNADSGENHFIGALDEVTIFKKALTASEVADMFSAIVTGGDCAVTDSIQGAVLTSIVIAEKDGLDTVVVGNTLDFDVTTVLPANAYDKSVTFSADPASVATIDAATGVLTGVSAGSVTVKATANDIGAIESNSIVISVKNLVNRVESFTAQGLVIYPIPASSSLTIQLNDNFIGSTIRIADISGREVLNTLAEHNLMTIDVSKLRRGIYIVSIMSDRNTAIQKIILD